MLTSRSLTTAPVAVIATSVTLGGITAQQFTIGEQSAFVRAVSTHLNVATADVTITNLPTDAVGRRRLAATGLKVSFTVAAPTTPSVTALSSAITQMATTQSVAGNEGLHYVTCCCRHGSSYIRSANRATYARSALTSGPCAAQSNKPARCANRARP